MQYRYLQVFRVQGVLLPADTQEIILVSDPAVGERIVLTGRIDEHCSIIDRGRAIGISMARAFAGEGKGIPFKDKLGEDIARIQKQREEQSSSGPFLVFEFSDQTAVDLSGPSADLGNFSVVFDAVDKDTIRTQHQSRIAAVLTSLRLVVGGDFQADAVTGGLYLVEDGHLIHSFSVRDSMSLTVSRTLTDDSIKQVAEYLHLIAGNANLNRVYCLLAQAITENSDRLRAFLFAWTALEVLVNKLFKIHKGAFIAQRVSHAPVVRGSIDRVKELGGRSPWRDKFDAVSCVLLNDSQEAKQDMESFTSAKSTRDDFFHGADVDDDALPVQTALSLAKKYLRLHLDAMCT